MDLQESALTLAARRLDILQAMFHQPAAGYFSGGQGQGQLAERSERQMFGHAESWLRRAPG
jgi:hypothetical protein